MPSFSPVSKEFSRLLRPWNRNLPPSRSTCLAPKATSVSIHPMYPTVVPNHPCVLRCNSKWFEPCLTHHRIPTLPPDHPTTNCLRSCACRPRKTKSNIPKASLPPAFRGCSPPHLQTDTPQTNCPDRTTRAPHPGTSQATRRISSSRSHGKFARHIEPTSPHPWVFTPTMYYSFFFRKEIIGIVGLLIGLITHWTFVWRRWSSTAFTMLSRLIDAYGVVIIRRLMGSFTIWPALIINQIQGNWWAKVMCTSPPFVCASWAEFVPQNVWFLASLEQAYKRTTLPNFLSIGFPTAKGANSHFYVDDTT